MSIRSFALLSAVAALLGAVITLTGWVSGLPRLTDWDGDGISMLPNTAFAAAAASGALTLLLAARSRPWARAASRTLALLSALGGGLTLLQHLTGFDLGIDRLLIEPTWGARAATTPGRMGPPASITFVLLGVSLALASARMHSGRRKLAAGLAVAALAPPVLAWTAYFYGADSLYSMPRYTGIAQQTASILFLIAAGLVLAVEEHGLSALVHRRDSAGTLVRRLLPISVVLLLITGWLEDLGLDLGLYEPSFGHAALTVVRIFMFGGLLWWTASTIAQQIQRGRSLESALSESRERFEVMADVIPQLAWMARPDGWIYWYNRRWYEYTGATPEEMEGWGWRSVHDQALLPAVERRFRAAIQGGEDWEDTFPLRGADGAYRWFLSRARPIRDEAGRVTHWFGTNTDVSDQRAASDALREANRLKDEFLATLSHELRTPMSAILGWTQMLRRTAATLEAPPPELAEGLEVIERNGRLQAQIIDDLLDMSRILSGKVRLDVQTVDLPAVIGAAVDAIRPAAEAKELRLDVLCESGIEPIRGDPGRLQQAFYNLLGNAVKFTPRGGRVEVGARRVGSQVEVSVSDTGVGIQPEFLPQLFQRFRQQDATTTRSFGGLGLGLSIAKQLVELHGGTIHAASEGEHRGATFSVRLPVSVAVLPRPAAELEAADRAQAWSQVDGELERELEGERLSGVTALVVDDERDARDMLGLLLEQHGAKAVVTGSGAEALEELPRTLPDVLLCDIGMPGMDGYALIRAVRRLPDERGGRTPAIALTAFARSEDRVRAMLAGFQMHISKPADTAELLAGILSLTGPAAAR